MSHFFYSLLKFCIGLFLIITGILAIVLPWFTQVRTSLVDWILQGSVEMVLFGAGFLLIGLYLVIYSLWHSKTRYYRIQMDNPSILITEGVVQDYLNTYWRSLFPSVEIPCRIEMQKKKIGIQADLPSMSLEDQKTLLERIEKDLAEIFRQNIGYGSRLDIKISFQKAH